MNAPNVVAFPGVDLAQYAPRRPRRKDQVAGIPAARAALRDAAAADARADRQAANAVRAKFDAETVALRSLEALANTPAQTSADLAMKLEAFFDRVSPLAEKGPLPALIESLRADVARLLGR
ncbi:MAG: hypothetical protein IT566_07410 [Rhodospirillaceae bacterium]|nr:hypothetical protein [Rhodospirillaceae bacterium]